MRTELLPPGQNQAEIGAPPQSAEGRNAGGQAGLTGSAAWMEGLEAEKADGGVASLGAERGEGEKIYE